MRCFFLRLYARLFIRNICVSHAEEKSWYYYYDTGDYYGCGSCRAIWRTKQQQQKERKAAKKEDKQQRRLNVLKALRKCKGE